MNCPDCQTKFKKPEIIDNVAYFICNDCGYCHEEEGYQELTFEETVKLFENTYKIKLPKEFIKFKLDTNDFVFKAPITDSENIKNYDHEKYWELEQFFKIEKGEGLSIFDTEYLINEWDLPKNLVLIAGDGHYWYALDYRDKTKEEPKVIFIESENSDYSVLAETFKEFTESLIRQDQIN